MYIITVIPIIHNKIFDTLFYFTSENLSIGTIVSVPLRSKNIHAIILESRQVEDVKQEIKSAPYTIRKLNKIKAVSFFPTTFIEAVKKIANYYVGNIGSVIDTLSSNTIIDNVNSLALPEIPQGKAIQRRLNMEKICYAVQGEDEDRMSSWRSLIRQEFAMKRSIVFYAPTIEDVENISQMISRGIENYVYVLHSALQKKKLVETWNSIAKNDHPIVIVCTPLFSLFPRSDIDTIILERENERGWFSQKSPFIDMRHALSIIASTNGQILYFADNLLRMETQYRIDNHEIIEGSPFKKRSVSLAKDILIDMTTTNNNIGESGAVGANLDPESSLETDSTQGKKFKVLSDELKNLIVRNREENSHLFIYTVRRGHSPITACDDCGSIVSCTNCHSPLVLHHSQRENYNFYLCHNCGQRSNAEIKCENCTSWRLSPLGIGIDKVFEEISTIIKDVCVYKIDPDTTISKKQILETMNKFKQKPGSVLLGTNMVLPYLPNKIDYCAIASLDTLFSLPDFRIAEKIMYSMIRLRSIATKSFLIQTRRSKEKIFAYGQKGNIADFVKDTLTERRSFHYPPYKTLIKLSIEGKKDQISNDMAIVRKELSSYEVDIFPAFTATSKGLSAIHGLIKIDSHFWPNNDLISKLKSLSPKVQIEVDPDSLL